MSVRTSIEQLLRVPGAQVVKKFGENSATDTNYKPISNGGVYPTPMVTSGTCLKISSTSSWDTHGSVGGAWSVFVEGLNTSCQAITETVSLNGLNTVTTVNTYIRCYRAFVSGTGIYATQTSASHVGTLTITDSAGAAYAQILPAGFARSQTEIGAFSCDGDNDLYVGNIILTAGNTKVVDVVAYRRDLIDTASAPHQAARVFFEAQAISGEVTYLPPTAYGPFTGPCDVGFLAKVSQSTGAVGVNFTCVKIPKRKQ